MAKISTHRTAAKVPRKQPETLRLASLTPSLVVKDLQRSIRWYRDVLGFHVREEWKDHDVVTGVVLRAGSVDLRIGQDPDAADGRGNSKGVRIHCGTRQDIDSLAELVKSRGGTLAQEPTDQPWGVRDFAVKDPDGYLLTFAKQPG
jgi:catechol 2,3-dioxygenase-like lactoylglutathione lyase family enzyme